MAALLTSAENFDKGAAWEASRIATAVATIALDRRNSRSLVAQLDAGDMKMLGTAVYEISDRTLNAASTLVGMRMRHPPEYVAHCTLDDEYGAPAARPWWRLLKREQWWEQVVMNLPSKELLSRKQIILSMRDMEGGAHVDPETTEAIAVLTRGDPMNMYITENGITAPFDRSPLMPTVRQIGFEVAQSVGVHFDEMLTRYGFTKVTQ